MKRLSLLGTILFFLSETALAQQGYSVLFLKGLQALVEDGAKGFPIATGDLKEDIGWYGRTYERRTALLGGEASLYWRKAQDNKYSAPTPERFYFSQGFDEKTTAGRFMLDSAELLIDAVAKKAGLRKNTIRQSKEYRKKMKVTEYQAPNGKPAFGITRYLKDPGMVLNIYSSYRPEGIVVPNFLGCLAFTYGGMSYLDVVPVYGPSFSKEKDAPAAARRYDMATSYHKYQWYPGRTASSLENEFGKSTTVRVLEPYTVE